MAKFILLILAAGLSVLTELLIGLNNPWVFVGLFVAFFIGYIIVFAIIFFGLAIILGLPVSLKRKPTKFSKFYHSVFTAYTNFGLSLFGFVLHTKGTEKIPQNSKFLVVQNHISNFDPVITNSIFKKHPLIFVSKNSLFHIPFFGKFIHQMGYISLTRISREADAEELQREQEWLNKDECSVCVYPEGKRNKTYPNPLTLMMHAGSFDFARQAKKDIVVTVIRGTEDVKNNVMFKPHHIYFEVLDVLKYEDYKKLSNIELANKTGKMMETWLKESPTKGFKKEIR